MLTGAGVPADYAEFLGSIFYPVREGWTAAVTEDVQHPHRPRAAAACETYARDNKALLA